MMRKKDYQGVSLASYSYKYPDSSSFDSAFSKETTKYKDKLGNWQTVYPFTEPEFNVLYYINGTAAKDGITGQTKKSDDFTIYKVTQYDTLPKISELLWNTACPDYARQPGTGYASGGE